MDQLLQDQFGDASWSRWRTVLRATFAETMSKADLEVFEELTGRTSAPTEPARELWAICGRRAGKSMVAALIAVFCSTCREYQFAHGERGTFMLVAADRRQARVMHRYITGLLNSHPVLESLIVSQTKTAIELNNGIDIEIMTASYRTIRGYSCIGAVLDELAFWPVDDAAEPDREIIAALRPAMATVPEAVLVCVSSPYARRGELWRAHRAHYGQDDDDILVVQGTTQQLNPTISEAVIARAYQDDPINARAEYGAEFRSDAEGFVTSEAIQGCVVPDRLELRPIKGERYVAFIDFAGGSGADSATLAIAHEEKRNDQRVLILDAIREVKPP
ncbi:MAG: hypothetical protein QF680_03295, partial [Acidobacteriota bacterium]|nr:hypothetical protein [Acidobacteriota bacterium]